MDRDQFNKAFGERVAPLLEELGVEGFVMLGYVADGQGRLTRFVSGHTNNNPAVEDGLSKFAAMGAMWSAPSREFGPPPAEPKQDAPKPGEHA